MERGKKLLVAAVLLLVIAGTAVFLGKKFGTGGPKRPDWILEEPLEKIDNTTMEIIMLPRRKWENLGQQYEMYKNPHTGKYAMVPVMVCGSCGEKIPSVPQPKLKPGEGLGEYRGRWIESMQNYKCPKCGKSAYTSLPPSSQTLFKPETK